MPTLLLDRQKCLRNMERMAAKAAGKGLSLRPHFKTHQSENIGNWFREFGVSKITVSSVEMAARFTGAGWDDILVAFPFNPQEAGLLDSLTRRCRISLLFDNPETPASLKGLTNSVDFYVDVDTGYGRTGVPSSQPGMVEGILKSAGKTGNLEFRGFYCHAGHSYRAKERQELDAIHRKALDDLQGMKALFGHFDPVVLYGDTPGCSIQEDFSGIDEITPGNFVFYDLMQVALGSCKPEDVAIVLKCPVTGKYPQLDQLVIHGGAVHFSKEALETGGRKVFGQLVEPSGEGSSGEGWNPSNSGVFISEVSQEHGIIRDAGDLLQRTSIGDNLLFLPVHSCLAANLMKEYCVI